MEPADPELVAILSHPDRAVRREMTAAILAANRSTEQALPATAACANAADAGDCSGAVAVSCHGVARSARLRQPVADSLCRPLDPGQGFAIVVPRARNVARRMPVTITVIGDGPMRQEWQQAAANLNLPVDFLGACAQATVARELQRCHVFCLPSIRESGGAVLLEAMSAARPVLAVDYGGPAELVNDEVGRLAPAHSPESVVAGLAAALQDIIVSPQTWKARGEPDAAMCWRGIPGMPASKPLPTLHNYDVAPRPKGDSLCATC